MLEAQFVLHYFLLLQVLVEKYIQIGQYTVIKSFLY